jgi:hypothetical protein
MVFQINSTLRNILFNYYFWSLSVDEMIISSEELSCFWIITVFKFTTWFTQLFILFLLPFLGPKSDTIVSFLTIWAWKDCRNHFFTYKRQLSKCQKFCLLFSHFYSIHFQYYCLICSFLYLFSLFLRLVRYWIAA